MKLKGNLLLLFIILALAGYIISSESTQQKQFREQAFFCPEDNCASQLIQKINAAEKSINVAVYSFTSNEIADALIAAKNRGVEVNAIMDSVQAANEYSEDERLKQNGIGVRIKRIERGSMHNKFAVIDNALVATGSFNYSENADKRNDENLVFLANPETIAAFEAEFQELWQEAS